MNHPQPATRGPRPGTRIKILNTTKEILAKGGFSTLTVEAVASRSGVAKTTIYRHYRSRVDLALAVLIAMLDDLNELPKSNDTLADLAATVDKTIDMLENTLMGDIMKGLVSEIAQNPDFAREYHEKAVSRRVKDVAELLRRGVDQGQIRSNLDPEHVTDLLLGPIYYRFFLAGTGFSPNFGASLVASLNLAP